MLVREVREEDADPGTPCVCCAKPSAAVVWGHSVCWVCMGDWFDDSRFSSKAIEEALGAEIANSLANDESAKELKRRTDAWVLEQRKARAS